MQSITVDSLELCEFILKRHSIIIIKSIKYNNNKINYNNSLLNFNYIIDNKYLLY